MFSHWIFFYFVNLYFIASNFSLENMGASNNRIIIWNIFCMMHAQESFNNV